MMDAARKEKLGRRWACYSCEGKFYDLNKPEPICPKCSADQRESPAFDPKKAKKKATKKKAAAKKATKKKAVRKSAKKADPADDGADALIDQGVDLGESISDAPAVSDDD